MTGVITIACASLAATLILSGCDQQPSQGDPQAENPNVLSSDGIDTFQAMAERGVLVVDRVVQEEMGGGVDLVNDLWFIPGAGAAMVSGSE